MNNQQVIEALKQMKGGKSSALSRVVGGSSCYKGKGNTTGGQVKVPKNIGKYTTTPKRNDHLVIGQLLSGGMSLKNIGEISKGDILKHANNLKNQFDKKDIAKFVKIGKKALGEVSNHLQGDNKKYFDMGLKYADVIMQREGLTGSGFWGDFKKGFNSVMRPTANISKALAPIASAVLGPEMMLVPMALEGMAQASGSGKQKQKRKLSDKQIKRNALVKSLMREHNITLPQASKYIKENSLM